MFKSLGCLLLQFGIQISIPFCHFLSHLTCCSWVYSSYAILTLLISEFLWFPISRNPSMKRIHPFLTRGYFHGRWLCPQIKSHAVHQSCLRCFREQKLWDRNCIWKQLKGWFKFWMYHEAIWQALFFLKLFLFFYPLMGKKEQLCDPGTALKLCCAAWRAHNGIDHFHLKILFVF